MLQLAVLAASLSSALAAHATHSISVAQCVGGCEAKNECRSSLESLSCEASCHAVCKCEAISHRMLNKPKHCMSDVLKEHQKRLSLFRMGHPRMKKVVLKDDQADSDFASYVPLEDFWPHSHPDEPHDESKPLMLNSPAQLSLLRKEALPWSPEHRSLGSRSKHHHRHHNAALLEKKKKGTKTDKHASLKKTQTGERFEKPATAAIIVEAKKKVVTNMTASSNVTFAKNATSVHASRVGSTANTSAKPLTTTNSTSLAKVAAQLNSTKFAAGEKASKSAKKK